jgi:hypothetical protein
VLLSAPRRGLPARYRSMAPHARPESVRARLIATRCSYKKDLRGSAHLTAPVRNSQRTQRLDLAINTVANSIATRATATQSTRSSAARARPGDVGAHPTPSGCGWASTDGRLALKQFTPPDPGGHLLRLLAIDRPVVEFDNWILALSAQLLERVSLAATERSFTTSYWMPCSSSAFWTFQQGCALILTHIFGQRWSLIATFHPST